MARLPGNDANDPPLDPFLVPLVEAADDAERRSAIERIVLSAHPLIEQIVARSRLLLRDDEVDDVVSTINYLLVRRLGDIVNGAAAIQRFHDFVAAVTYRAIYGMMRRRFPQRTRLKNRLRYALTRTPRLALWGTPGEPAGGLREWAGQRCGLAPARLSRNEVPAAALDPRHAPQAVEAIFRTVGHPLLLDDLVDVAAQLWGVTDAASPVADDAVGYEDAGAERLLTSRQDLTLLWEEIRALPADQRAALLLNMREEGGGNGLALLVLTGIATFDAVAESLGVTAEQLAELWSALPLQDLRIASMLGVTRQQVINLRKAARARLTRRVASRERGRR
jgi:hypothetical protein